MNATQTLFIGSLLIITVLALCIWVLRFCHCRLLKSEEGSHEYQAFCIGIAIASGVLIYDLYLIMDILHRFAQL